MNGNTRTPRTRGHRVRRRQHHADRAFASRPVFDLTIEDVMADLDPGWPAGPSVGGPW